MERLTFDGNFCDIAMCRELPCQHDNNCTQKQVWERLKQYEDTGLTPEEVADMASVREISPETEYAINKHADSIIERLDRLLHSDGSESIVRCAECQYGDWDSKNDDALVCTKTNNGYWRSGKDFCSFGKRKDGGAENGEIH